MKHDAEESEREEERSDDAAGSRDQRRAGRRASMRPELMELFRNTESTTRSGAVGGSLLPWAGAATRPAAPADPTPPAEPAPSRFLRRFLQGAAPTPEPAPSGVATLDACLGGGFGAGLHLVLGGPGAGKTPFLESVAWEAVGSRRPVLYYPLESGSLPAWERLMATLASLSHDRGLPQSARDAPLAPADRDALIRLDAELQSTVLPYLSLLETVPGGPVPSGGFLEDLQTRSREAVEHHGRLPLVLIDDLDALLVRTGTRSPLQLLSRLDAALAVGSLPGLLAARQDGGLAPAVRRLPAQTVTVLRPEGMGRGPRRVYLDMLTNATTGWTGVVPLLFDPASGLFAEAGPVRPRRR